VRERGGESAIEGERERLRGTERATMRERTADSQGQKEKTFRERQNKTG